MTKSQPPTDGNGRGEKPHKGQPGKKRRTREEKDAARIEMRARLLRKRAKGTPEEQGALQGKPPRFHDMLIIGPVGGELTTELYRVPVVKVAKPAPNEQRAKPAPNEPAVGAAAQEVVGTYVDLPEKLDLFDYAQRRTMNVARPREWKTPSEVQRGPAFGTLPVKREPAATHCFACYLVNSENLSFRNAWTAEEWNDIGAEDLPPHPSADDDKLEVLIAGPRGKVFYLKVKLEQNNEDAWAPGHRVAFAPDSFVESLNLRHEVEVWSQLRNGLVGGRVLSRRKASLDGVPIDKAEFVPLVNITSYITDDPAATLLMNQAQPERPDQ